MTIGMFAATRLAGSPVRPAVEDGSLRCQRCLSETGPDVKFCGECGAPLRVRCERKRVTVLFTDVSGFTAMSERLDPEEVRAIVNRAFAVILDVVHWHEGTVNQFLGDGVMALFGASAAREDHPSRAVRAGLAIRESLEPLRDDVRRAHGMEFRVRVGINTGFVVVGTIGKELRRDYIALGDTTRAAARLLSVAEAGQIVVSARTRSLTESAFVFDDLGRIVVDGSVDPVCAYAIAS